MSGNTIAAIATAMTNSGIGIVRVSGEDSLQIIDKIYRSKEGNKKLSQMPSHTIHYGFICDETKIVDEVMVLIMKAPHSYTAEDTVEIDCHGGALVMKRILETVIKNGARPAEPGEFTKRAFLNGRIDLSQAESVLDVINAKNDFALKSSMRQLQGGMKEKIKQIREKMIHEIAWIESALDDPEHITLEGFSVHLYQEIEKIYAQVNQLLQNSEDGELLKEGIDTVIVGKPNAGKSSLLNTLVGKDRAIVTDMEGTTRDVLEEQINLNGITLNIMDTAGIRETENLAEKIGVQKTKEYLTDCDLVLYVVDSSTEFDPNDEEILQLIRKQKVIVLLNKSDLLQKISAQDLEKRLLSYNLDFQIISMSVKENKGVDELKIAIEKMFFKKEIYYNDEIYLTNIRQKAALHSALESLSLVKDSIEKGMPEDFYSIDLMDAYESLGKITGETVGEDLINEIFSKFCMGK